MAYNAATGAKLWVSRYDNGDQANALILSPDGTKVFVTGIGNGPTSNDYGTVAYDSSTGTKLWARRYGGPGNGDDEAWGLGVSPDGSRVFVTGGSLGSTGHFDYATIAYDASTGATQWLARYNEPAANTDNFAYALGVSPDGTAVFVTGESNFDYATIGYDATTGAKLWVSRYNGPADGPGNAYALGVSPDGATVFVTGQSWGLTGGFDYATVAYDASTGKRLWLARYNGPGNSEDDAFSLGMSPDGTRVFVTGPSGGVGSGYDYATVAYDGSTGARLWVARYNGPGNSNDYAYSSGVSPDGTEVFVTGQSCGSTGDLDYATIAYSAGTGAQLWVKRHSKPGNDEARSVGVSPDGATVFVTGGSQGDYTTIAYSTN